MTGRWRCSRRAGKAKREKRVQWRIFPAVPVEKSETQSSFTQGRQSDMSHLPEISGSLDKEQSTSQHADHARNTRADRHSKG